MTTRIHIESTVRSFYAARVKGDLEATMKDLAEDVVFELNGRGTACRHSVKRPRGKLP